MNSGWHQLNNSNGQPYSHYLEDGKSVCKWVTIPKWATLNGIIVRKCGTCIKRLKDREKKTREEEK